MPSISELQAETNYLHGENARLRAEVELSGNSGQLAQRAERAEREVEQLKSDLELSQSWRRQGFELARKRARELDEAAKTIKGQGHQIDYVHDLLEKAWAFVATHPCGRVARTEDDQPVSRKSLGQRIDDYFRTVASLGVAHEREVPVAEQPIRDAGDADSPSERSADVRLPAENPGGRVESAGCEGAAGGAGGGKAGVPYAQPAQAVAPPSPVRCFSGSGVSLIKQLEDANATIAELRRELAQTNREWNAIVDKLQANLSHRAALLAKYEPGWAIATEKTQ